MASFWSSFQDRPDECHKRASRLLKRHSKLREGALSGEKVWRCMDAGVLAGITAASSRGGDSAENPAFPEILCRKAGLSEDRREEIQGACLRGCSREALRGMWVMQCLSAVISHCAAPVRG